MGRNFPGDNISGPSSDYHFQEEEHQMPYYPQDYEFGLLLLTQ
jgi:hypothetical protein